MLIYFYPRGAGSVADSVDPGVDNVVLGVDYTIDGVDLTGTYVNDFPTAAQIADAVWSKSMAGYSDTSKFGGYVKLKILTVSKFLGLK